MQTTTDPFGGLSSLTYNTTTGDVATSVDPLVHTTTFTRDSMGRVTSTIYADGNSESFVYNSAGLLDYHLDKMGTKDQPTYDVYARGLVSAYSERLALRVRTTTRPREGHVRLLSSLFSA